MGAASVGDDDDDASDDLNNGGAAAASGLPSDAQSTASAAAFSVLKQEFVADESFVKQEFDGDTAAVSGAVSGAGSSGQVQSYAMSKKLFSSPATTATTTALAVAEAGGASLGGGGGGGAATPLMVNGEQEPKGVVPGALLAAHNAAASAKAAAEERRGFIGDAQKRDRFDEFVTGFLSMSLFHAADVWLPLSSASGSGSGNKKVSRLFLYSSNVQDPALAKWSTLSRNVVLASGVGLPGIVFQERRPQWAVRNSYNRLGVFACFCDANHRSAWEVDPSFFCSCRVCWQAGRGAAAAFWGWDQKQSDRWAQVGGKPVARLTASAWNRVGSPLF